MSASGLHADFIRLKPGSSAAARDGLVVAAADLAGVPGVTRVFAVEADRGAAYDLVTLFFLENVAAIEPFGTDQRYARFLQVAVAPLLQRLDGADLETGGTPGAAATYAACLAIAAPIETYDWEIRERIDRWRGGRGEWTISGLATSARDRFRGAALLASEEPLAAVPVAGEPAVEIIGKLRELS